MRTRQQLSGLGGEIEGQVTNIAQSAAINECLEHIFLAFILNFFYCFEQFRQGGVIGTIQVTSSHRN